LKTTTTPETAPQGIALAGTESHLDAYRATIRGATYDEVLGTLLAHLPPGSRYVRKDKNPADPRLALIELPHDNSVGIRWNKELRDAYIDLQGPESPRLIAACRELSSTVKPRDPWPQCFRTNRIDGAIDVDAPGVFEEAVQLARQAHATLYGDKPESLRPKIDQRGDWENPEKGRTLYIGSRQSILLRIYEKGKQLASVKGIKDASPHLVRIEVEAHPQDAAAFIAHNWTPLEVIATSRIAIEVVSALLGYFPTFTPYCDAGIRSPIARRLINARNVVGPLFWDLARRYDSPEAAARVLVAALSASQLTPAYSQRLIERGVSAPELMNLLGLHDSPED
jgi:Replication initiation factor